MFNFLESIGHGESQTLDVSYVGFECRLVDAMLNSTGDLASQSVSVVRSIRNDGKLTYRVLGMFFALCLTWTPNECAE